MHFDSRILVCVLSVSIGSLVVGCSPASDSEVVKNESDGGVVDGGTIISVDTHRVQEYFDALAKVRSVQEEEKLISDFADWLSKNGYKIVIEEKNGKHVLLCPYFPPVTPWTSHSFLDIRNLEMLPK